MNPFHKRKQELLFLRSKFGKKAKEAKVEPTEVLFEQCSVCKTDISKVMLSKMVNICPECGHHFKISAKERLQNLLDNGTKREFANHISGSDPLGFPGYRDKLRKTIKKTGLSEAVVCATGRIDNHKVVIATLDNSFFMGSMGSAVGEKITRAIEYATKHKLPLIIISTSGGARMQEGIHSLFQMAKTSAALKKHSDANLLYISILTHPTTGGVTASFASLGDIILAEPKALIGFAGPRVIEQTIKQSLPSGFQSSEYLMEHGFIDSIVPRDKMRETLSLLLSFHERKK